MIWPFSKRTTVQPRKPANEIKASMREKLSTYQPSEKRSVFIGPALNRMGDFFEYEKVQIDPESSGFHHVPFNC